MDWEAHKSHWPNAEHSRFVDAAPHLWHVQSAGTGSDILLLHGAGASTHSWNHVFKSLSEGHRVTAIDLPGQGFTALGDKSRCGLHTMAEDIAALLTTIEMRPQIIVGHSAGAAIAIALATRLAPQPKVLSINGAFENFPGLAGVLFPAVAKMLSLNPATGRLFSYVSSGPSSVRRLIASTGSTIPEEMLTCYQALVSDPGHVNAALAMMAQWSLDDMPQTLAQVAAPVRFLVADGDRTVRPAASRDAAARVAGAHLELVQGKGHLMHEEDPEYTAEYIRDFARNTPA